MRNVRGRVTPWPARLARQWVPAHGYRLHAIPGNDDAVLLVFGELVRRHAPDGGKTICARAPPVAPVA